MYFNHVKVFHSQDIEEVQIGDILISEPLLPDSNFSRSVVLVCENEDDTHFGFIINKPLVDVRLQGMVEQFSNLDKEVFLGGPVQQDHLQCIYKDGGIKNSVPLKDGYYWGGDFDEVSALILKNNESINDYWFYLGYSGWEKGQLKQELKDNAWLVARPDLNVLLKTPSERVWKESLSSLGKKFERMAEFPVDARLN